MAGDAGSSGFVSESSDSVRSLIKPALHVGKQIEGGVGCLACTGSAGIAGADTTGGGKLGDTLAQPLTNVAGRSSISASTRQVLFSFINHPLELSRSALFFGASCFYGDAGCALQLSKLLGVLRLGCFVSRALVSQSNRLQSD